MAFKLDDKNNFLKAFRKKYSRFAKECEQSMSYISQKELDDIDSMRTYIRRINFLKEVYQLSYKKIANAFGVTHTSIEKILPSLSKEDFLSEFEIKIKKIDIFYLEIFALYFGVSPIYLIGLTDLPSKYEPDGEELNFGLMNEQETLLSKAIVLNLFNDNNKRKLLWDIVKISDARIDWLNNIKKCLFASPKIKNLSCRKFDYDIEKHWSHFLVENIEYKEIIDKCVVIIGRLFMVDYDLINAFAHISLSSEASIIVHEWLNFNELLSKSKVFVHNFFLEEVAENIFDIKIIDKPFKYDDILLKNIPF